MEVFNFFLLVVHLFLFLLQFSTVLEQCLVLFLPFKSFFCEGHFLRLNLLLELVDLMVYYFIPSFCLGNFVLCFGEELAVSVSARSDVFVQFLLLFKLVFSFYVLFLVLGYQVSLQLDLLKGLKVLGIG